jgi:hypothetical protein
MNTIAMVLVMIMAIVAAVQTIKLVDTPDVACNRDADLLSCTNRIGTLDYVLLAILAMLVVLMVM